MGKATSKTPILSQCHPPCDSVLDNYRINKNQASMTGLSIKGP